MQPAPCISRTLEPALLPVTIQFCLPYTRHVTHMTYGRYAVGSNPQNPHLKGGVVAAFGLVRAAAAADMLQSASTQGPFALEVIGTSALYAGQSVLMFGFAAAAIEVRAEWRARKRRGT